MRTILLTTLFVLLAVALAACAGTPPTNTNEPGSPATPAQGPAAAPNSGSNGASGSSSFGALAAKGRDLRYTVTYEMTTSGAGTMNGTMTQFYGGPNEYRMDSTLGSTTTRTYVLNGTITSCFSQGGSWYCTQQSSGRNETVTPPSASVDTYASNGYSATNTGTETIAGTIAHCFRFALNSSSADYCLSPEGIPLKVDVAAGQVRTTMLATSYSTKLPGGVWDIPASQPMPGMPPMPPGYGG